MLNGDYVFVLCWHIVISFFALKKVTACCVKFMVYIYVRMLQPPHKFENFVVATSTLAQVVGFAQKPFWSSFVKIGQCLGVAQ